MGNFEVFQKNFQPKGAYFPAAGEEGPPGKDSRKNRRERADKERRHAAPEKAAVKGASRRARKSAGEDRRAEKTAEEKERSGRKETAGGGEHCYFCNNLLPHCHLFYTFGYLFMRTLTNL
ncbi:MAG: hypothetical protein NC209_07470 [Alistipes sp.]|nr:hypothetical protein [Alistipes senegalensis]MCM1250963.1 hypothetical protein [Alistipes sp.]